MDEKKKQASGPVKWILIGISVIFLFVMLVLPLVVVVTQALSKGWQCYVQAVTDEYTLKALKLTIGATAAAVVCNTIFGLCAAWAMTRFHFRGKKAPYHFDRCSGYSITGYRRSYLYPGFWKAESSLFCS